MKRVINLFTVLSIILFSNAGISQWVWQNPLPQGNVLNRVFSFDNNTAIAVGGAGAILRTTNAGANWLLQPSGVTVSLNGVSFVNANTGYAVGDGGTILYTTNSGSSWSPRVSGTTTSLSYVSFYDVNNGIVVGSSGMILKTTNGGTNWATQPSGVTASFKSVCFLGNSNLAIAVGSSGTILYTSNGGTNWTTQTSGLTQSLSDVSFSDVNNGTAVGSSGKIIRTTNGGINWTAQTSGVSVTLGGVSFTDSLNGTITGGNGNVLRTTNGGANWTVQSLGVVAFMQCVRFKDANNGIIVGAYGIIMRTTNGGANWNFQGNAPTVNNLNGVCFVDDYTGYAAGAGGTILKTTNGGNSWVAQSSGITTQLNAIAFCDANTGIAAGESGTIVRTTNGGNNWSSITTGFTSGFYGVAFPKYGSATLAGFCTICHSSDGGLTWTQQLICLGYLYGVNFANENTGFAVGYDGEYYAQIYKTTNAGVNWNGLLTTIEVGLTSANFIDANTGTIVGWGGTIIRTTDGGGSWATQTNGNMYSLVSVSFKNANTGYAVGTNPSAIYGTTNGGTNWVTVSNITTNNLNSVYTTSGNGVTTVGVGGTIIHLAPSLSAPSLSSPANDTVNIPLTPALVWNQLVGASSYRLQVTSDSTFATTTFDTASITGTSVNIPSGKLNNNTKYFWRVSATNSSGSGPYSTIWKFRTISSVPAIPTLISPTNGATNLAPAVKFDWNPVSGATSYRIKIATDTAFTAIVKDSILSVDSLALSGFLANGLYYWKVAAINSIGTGLYSSVWNFKINPTGLSNTTTTIPKEYKLYNNYPNPFNPTTKIKFDIPKNGLTKVAIYDMLGREVKTLINENMTAGSYELEWNATNYASGIYFYKMTAGNFTSIKKMVLIK